MVLRQTQNRPCQTWRGHENLNFWAAYDAGDGLTVERASAFFGAHANLRRRSSCPGTAAALVVKDDLLACGLPRKRGHSRSSCLCALARFPRRV
eukprot:362080-Chlamydomonas_euryale.AAC.2